MPAGSNSIRARFTDSDGFCFRTPAAAFKFFRNPRDGGAGRQLNVHGTLSHEPLWQGDNAPLPGD
jgi:hypothetical protein